MPTIDQPSDEVTEPSTGWAGNVDDTHELISRTERARRFALVAFVERRSARQRAVIAVIVGLAALAWLFRLTARLLLDRWWFADVADTSVWSTIFWAKVQPAVGAAVVSGAVLGVCLWRAHRVVPAVPAPAIGIVARYRSRMGPAHWWALIAIAAVATLRAGAGGAAHWQQWLLFRHGGDVGVDVPEFSQDLGYFLFDLPMWAAISSWLRSIVLLAIALSLAVFVVSGALRVPGGDRRSSPAAIAQLSVLAAVWLVILGIHHLLVTRPMLAIDRHGPFDGAGYTALTIIGPGTRLLAVASVVGAAALLWAQRRGSWRVAGAALAGVGLLHLLVMVAVPAVVQRLVVTPAEAERELTSIGHNLDATRQAYALDRVVERTEVLTDGLAGVPADADLEILAKNPLFTSDRLPAALQVLQGTAATRVTDVDLDRYVIDGEVRPMLVAARNPSRDDLPEQGWTQRHLVYTHGDGMVLVPADEPDADGRPAVDTATSLAPRNDALYFAEGLTDWYAIVDTGRREQGGTEFAAEGGIALDSFWRRAVVAAAVGEIEPVVSAEIDESARLLYRRDVIERIHALAPFLTLDSDPYPVAAGDSVVWIIDAYTTSATYPYSQFAAGAGGGSLGRSPFNAVRPSVRVTIDAAGGDVDLYRTGIGDDDVILAAWETIFPGLVQPIDAMPDEVRAHLRYPQDLFAVQTALLGRYHVDDAETLFDGSRRWTISGAPATAVGTAGEGTAPPVSMFLAGDGPNAGDWVAVQVFSPGVAPAASSARDELVAYAVGDHDDPEVLELVTVEAATARQLASPRVAQSAIDADPELARLFTLLNANGSSVEFGPMTLVAVDGGLAWTRPIIVVGTTGTTTPRLYGVVAVSGGIVGQGPDTVSAIRAAVEAAGT